MEYKELLDSKYILFNSIRGSHLYGLETETSDLDTYQVFCAPAEWVLGSGLWYQPQVSDPRNDNTAHELAKFTKELSKSNPDALLSLFTPADKILMVSPLFKPYLELRDSLVTKACFPSFRGYARSQINKAKGLNKSMNIDPAEVKERKTPLDFCFLHKPGTQGTETLKDYLAENNLRQEDCEVSRSSGIYFLYKGTKGIIGEDSNELKLSSISKGEIPVVSFVYNQNAYSEHCRRYREYHEWVRSRNPARYEENKLHSWDSKNMMHCLRLIRMGTEIANREGVFLDRREKGDRDFLLKVKSHGFEYQEIMGIILAEMEKMEEAFKKSTLPENPSSEILEELLVNTRKAFYRI